jgi:peroxiredoxin
LIDRLLGRAIPSVLLVGSDGDPVNLEDFAARSAAIYLYPGSGSSPDGGTDSPMLDAAQHRAYRVHEPDMLALNFAVVGISSQPAEAQRECAEVSRVRHTLLSDPNLLLADALELPTFEEEGSVWYRRLTIIVRHGRIGKVFYPMASPARNPAQVVAWATVQGP